MRSQPRLRQISAAGLCGFTSGADAFPFIHGKKVYYGYVNCLSTAAEYSNDFRYETIAEAHKYDETCLCTVCGKYGGDPDKPFPISSAEELKAFANAVNNDNGNLSVRLTADIDLNPGTVFDGRGDFSGDTRPSGPQSQKPRKMPTPVLLTATVTL